MGTSSTAQFPAPSVSQRIAPISYQQDAASANLERRDTVDSVHTSHVLGRD